MWLNQRFHKLYPNDEKYVYEIEKSLYNVAIAGQDHEYAIRYFAWLEGERVDGKNMNASWNPTHCCAGVAVRIYGMLPEFLYSINNDSVYLDIYGASEFLWEKEGNNVKITQITDMPYDSNVRIMVSCEKTEKFKVMIRIPSWVDGDVEVKIGTEKYNGSPGTYLCIERVWEAGSDNVIDFNLMFKWNLTKYTGVDQADGYERFALEYGPVLMAAVSDRTPDDDEECYDKFHDRKTKINYLDLFKLKLNPESYESWLVKDDKALHFKIKGYDDLMYMPYYKVEGGKYFACYPLFSKND